MSDTNNRLTHAQPVHGGDLQTASAQYGIEISNWIDLSTGINPAAFPIPEMPAHLFQNLPYPSEYFKQAVCRYYNQTEFLAVTGTQAAIQALPSLLNSNETLPILLPAVGYKEHQHHWVKSGNSCNYYPSLSVDDQITYINQRLDQNSRQHLLIINPNNPSGTQVSVEQLLEWSQRLEQGAYLIVDEAFIDATPLCSLLTLEPLPENIIVLRSFGKFFGLAGLRVGFVFSASTILAGLKDRLGIWQVNGPAQWLTQKAFADIAWQKSAIDILQKNKTETVSVFMPILADEIITGTKKNLFFTSYLVSALKAQTIQSFLAKNGVLVRLIEFENNRQQEVGDVDEVILRIGTLDRCNTNELKKIARLVDQLALSLLTIL